MDRLFSELCLDAVETGASKKLAWNVVVYVNTHVAATIYPPAPYRLLIRVWGDYPLLFDELVRAIRATMPSTSWICVHSKTPHVQFLNALPGDIHMQLERRPPPGEIGALVAQIPRLTGVSFPNGTIDDAVSALRNGPRLRTVFVAEDAPPPMHALERHPCVQMIASPLHPLNFHLEQRWNALRLFASLPPVLIKFFFEQDGDGRAAAHVVRAMRAKSRYRLPPLLCGPMQTLTYNES